MGKWVDISRWSGRVNQTAFLHMRERHGVEGVVVGLWHGRDPNLFAHGNLERARAAGLLTAGYITPNATRTGAWHIGKGREQAGPQWRNLLFVAVDCEINGITHDTIVSAINEVDRRGKCPIIYTARWWWRGRFGDPTEFSRIGIELWNAFYDYDEDIDFASAPYGGWTIDQIAGEQYTDTTDLEGVPVDMNTFVPEFIERMREREGQEDQVAIAELSDRVDALQGALRATNGILTAVGALSRENFGAIKFLKKTLEDNQPDSTVEDAEEFRIALEALGARHEQLAEMVESGVSALVEAFGLTVVEEEEDGDTEEAPVA